MHNQFVVVRIAGEERESTIAGRLRRSRPVVGDKVEVRELPDGSVRVEAVLPRHGILLRGAFRNEEKIVAANVDVLVIVAAVADPPLRAGLIDRYLVAAWRGGIEAMLALTKVDLPYDEDEVARVRELYGALGHRVVVALAALGRGPRRAARGAGRPGRRSGRPFGRGQDVAHQCAHGSQRCDRRAQPGQRSRAPHDDRRPLHGSPGGGALIDTAGIRSFGIAGVAAADLSRRSPRSPRRRRSASGKAACIARARTAAPFRRRPASRPSGWPPTASCWPSSRSSRPSAAPEAPQRPSETCES